MRIARLAAVGLATVMLPTISAASALAKMIVFPDRFDPIGTPVEILPSPKGRTIHFTDTGEPDWCTILFIGGVVTSARAPELVGLLLSRRPATSCAQPKLSQLMTAII